MEQTKVQIKENGRFIKKAADDKKRIEALSEEITALRQLLDCAAANIALLVEKQGGVRRISAQDVKKALGRYELHASRVDNDYIITVVEKTAQEAPPVNEYK